MKKNIASPILLDIKNNPLSVNVCWQGRRYKTEDYKRYEEEILWLLKSQKYKTIKGWCEVHYKFYVKNFKMCDTGNFEKPLTDILVKAKLIEDDRFILKLVMEKFEVKNKKDEYIQVKIYETNNNNHNL